MKNVRTELPKGFGEQHLMQRRIQCKDSETEVTWVLKEQPNAAGGEGENGMGTLEAEGGHKDKIDGRTL